VGAPRKWRDGSKPFPIGWEGKKFCGPLKWFQEGALLNSPDQGSTEVIKKCPCAKFQPPPYVEGLGGNAGVFERWTLNELLTTENEVWYTPEGYSYDDKFLKFTIVDNYPWVAFSEYHSTSNPMGNDPPYWLTESGYQVYKGTIFNWYDPFSMIWDFETNGLDIPEWIQLEEIRFRFAWEYPF
jgi:hypothetical protein